MPKLWSQTIEAHRYEVRGAIMETAWALAAEHGPFTVTMSQIAHETGIGRATLYKYFPTVESILREAHEGHVIEHLERLDHVARGDEEAVKRLRAVALMYARICFHRSRHGSVELSVLVHRPEDVSGAEREILELFEGLLTEAATNGEVRDDISARELAIFLVHALTAAGRLPSQAAGNRLVDVTFAALRADDLPRATCRQ